MRVKSIFRKQLTLYIGILIISFTLLGAVLTNVYKNYYIFEKEKELTAEGRRISDEFSRFMYMGAVDASSLNTRFKILEEYMGASVFLVDNTGEIMLVSSTISEDWVGQTITDKAKNGVLEGNVVTIQGKVGGIYSNDMLTVGCPITVKNTVVGGVFMNISMPEIESSVKEMKNAFLGCILAVALLGSVMIYFSSLKMSKPLIEMNEAAKVIASGNFDKRISIEGNDEISELGKSFNNMAESLEEHEKARRDFIANISHDLRSPLTSMQGFLNAVLDGTADTDDEKRYLGIVLDESKRLGKLTNDIIDLSAAQSDTLILNKSDFDINELIRDTFSSLEPRFKEKRITASAVFEREEIFVNADPDKIQRVVYNLLDNALKFTPESGKIEAETASDEKAVYVYIRDSGIGISEQNKKYVFDRFFKADASRGEDRRGGGIGLSIVREFIRAHKGVVTVKSEEGRGSEFVFSLPL